MSQFLKAPVAPSKWATMCAVSVGLAMLMIDTFILNVAFPAIGRDLNAGIGKAEWTISGYVLVLGVFPLAMGRLGDIFGRRLVYIIGLTVFILASLLCGLAANIEQLIAFRILQGFGAAVMMPGTLAIVTSAFPPEQRGLAIGVWGGVSGLGLIAGPLLGGLLVHGDSWRWIFLVNLPVGIGALFAAIKYIPETRDVNAPRSIDWVGAFLLAGGLALIMFAFTEANARGWTDPYMVACFVVGPLMLISFVAYELRQRFPLVDVRLFKNMNFTMACVTACLFSAAVFGSQPYTSLYMQNYLGFTPLQGGLAFIPATALVAAIQPFSGIIGQKLGSKLRILIIFGSLCVAASFIYLLQLDTQSGYLDGFLVPFLLRGLGIGLVLSSVSLAVMSSMPIARAGLASGTLTMFRQCGTALGVALFGAIFVHHIETDVPNRLANVDVAESARATEAAAHFVPSGDAEVRAATEESIVDGFVLTAVFGVVVAGVAATTALFVRQRNGVGRTAVSSPAPAAPPIPAGAGSDGG